MQLADFQLTLQARLGACNQPPTAAKFKATVQDLFKDPTVRLPPASYNHYVAALGLAATQYLGSGHGINCGALVPHLTPARPQGQ